MCEGNLLRSGNLHTLAVKEPGAGRALLRDLLPARKERRCWGRTRGRWRQSLLGVDKDGSASLLLFSLHSILSWQKFKMQQASKAFYSEHSFTHTLHSSIVFRYFPYHITYLSIHLSINPSYFFLFFF